MHSASGRADVQRSDCIVKKLALLRIYLHLCSSCLCLCPCTREWRAPLDFNHVLELLACCTEIDPMSVSIRFFLLIVRLMSIRVFIWLWWWSVIVNLCIHADATRTVTMYKQENEVFGHIYRNRIESKKKDRMEEMEKEIAFSVIFWWFLS